MHCYQTREKPSTKIIQEQERKAEKGNGDLDLKTLIFLFMLVHSCPPVFGGYSIYDPFYDEFEDYFGDTRPDNGSCNTTSASLGPIEDLMGKKIPELCKEQNPFNNNEYCKCLNVKKDQNILLGDLKKNQNDSYYLKKETYENKFKSSYSQMVIEENIQRHILNETEPNDGGARFECNPENMAELVEFNKKNHFNELEKLLQNQKADLEKQKNRWCEKKNQKKDKIKGRCEEALSYLKLVDEKIKNIEQDKISLQQKLVEYPNCDTENLSTLQSFYSNPELSIPEDKKDLVIKLLSLSEKSCAKDSPEIIQEASNLMTTILVGQKYPECNDLKNPPQKCVFLSMNSMATKKFTDKYKFDEETQCISFAEYKTYKSLPDQAFFDELLNSKDPLKFLRTVPVPQKKNENYEKKLKFLRSNPMLTSALQHPGENKAKLNNLLKNLASELKSKNSDAQKLKTYLDFLKNKDGLQAITKSIEGVKGEAKVCADLARNYTAIKVANYFPEVDESSPGVDRQLAKELRSCSKKQAIVPNNALLTLDVDPVFNLGDENQKKSDVDETADYEKFRKENCITVKDKIPYEEYLKKECKQPKKTSDCRKEFLALSPFAPIRDATSGYPLNTDDGLGPDPAGTILDPLKEENQDDEFFSWFKDSVLPGYMVDPLGVNGMKSYITTRNFGDGFKGTTPPPSRSNISESFSNPIAKSIGRKSTPIGQPNRFVNPGQVLPKFNSPSSFSDPSNFGPSPSRGPASFGKGAQRDYSENQYSRSNTDFNQTSRNAVSDNKGDVANNSTPSSQDIEKAQEFNQKIKDLNPRLDNGGNAQFEPSTTASGALSFDQGGVGASIPNRRSAPVALGDSPLKKGTFNDALNSIHEKSAMTVLGGVIDPSEFKGPQQSAKDLIVDDPQKFEKLGEDPALLEAFIKEKMKGMTIGESKIITIINASPNRPVPHMIFRIKAKADGSFDIQSVPSDVPVRVATLKSLVDYLPKNN